VPSDDSSAPPAPSLSIVVPAYNEEGRIGATLDAVIAYMDARGGGSWELLVVDDGSSDGTGDVVREHAGKRAEVALVRYDPNAGKGRAVRMGMLRARGERVLFSDADLATPIEELEHLMAALDGGADIAIGSRDVPGAQLERRQSAIREAGGKLFNRFVQALAVPGIHDTQCGFKLFTRASAQAVFRLCQVDNFSFDVEALYLARRLGLAIVETPVRWRHQEGSKVRFVRDAVRMLATLRRIRTTRYDLAPVTSDRPGAR